MKQFLLTAISMILIILVINTGYNREWFRDKPVQYWGSFLWSSRNRPSPDRIRQMRYGADYAACLRIRDSLLQRKASDPLILVEPNTYFRDSLHCEFRMPEPAVFYYYTGLRTVWMDRPDALKAEFFVRVSADRKITLEKIGTRAQLEAILRSYQRFSPQLLF